MHVRVLLFAQVREIIGADNIEIELQPSQESTVTAAEIKQAVKIAAQADEALSVLLDRSMVAVDNEYAMDP